MRPQPSPRVFKQTSAQLMARSTLLFDLFHRPRGEHFCQKKKKTDEGQKSVFDA